MITNKDAIKQLLGGTFSPSEDALLDKLAAAAHDFMVSYLGYDPITGSYTEVRDGNGLQVIALDAPNVTAVSSVRVNERVIPAALDANSSGYVFSKDGFVYLRNYTFTKGVQNVTVNYTAGLNAYPGDLVMAATEHAAFKYRTKQNIGIQSKTLAQETIVFSASDMPQSVRAAYAPYRRTLYS